jgi:hypothetical protein
VGDCLHKVLLKKVAYGVRRFGGIDGSLDYKILEAAK